MNDKIIIKGARENNLKNVDLTIPRDKLVVFTGLYFCMIPTVRSCAPGRHSGLSAPESPRRSPSESWLETEKSVTFLSGFSGR